MTAAAFDTRKPCCPPPGRGVRTITAPAGLWRRTALLLAAVLVLATAALLAAAPARAQARTPLLMEGKQTLYQRVLSRPAAVLRERPDPAARTTVAQVPPFTIYYVFARQTVNGVAWVEVGRPVNGPAEGWVPADQVIDWKQTMTVAFTNPAGRERTLFFENRAALTDLLGSPQLAPRAAELRRQAETRTLPPDNPVISIEPAEFIDISRQFYLLPILGAETSWLASGFTTRLLRVASIPLRANPLAAARPSAEEILRDFKVGIVFVIDTTVSMGPYIDRTREAVRRIIARIGNSDIGQRVRFGVVGFRDDPREVPGLDYVTRVFVPLHKDQDTATVLRGLGQVAEARVSSAGFDEDSLAGVNAALEMPGWADFGGRYVILITDAGPRPASDPFSTTHMGPREINRLAQDNQIAIYSMHLLTPAGADDHAAAEAAYRELSRFQNASLYYPVPDGSVPAFGRQVDALTESLIAGVRDTLRGRLSEAGAAAPGDDPVAQTPLVGRAMQLAYLGRRQGTQAPDVFQAWAADHDFADPRRTALEVRVLLTKNQLSDLSDVLSTILDLGQRNRLSPDDFFGQLRSAVAHLSRNPDRLGQAAFRNLGQLLGEYLEDLPYQSQIMEIDEPTWLSMGPGAQREVLDAIAAKLRLYRRYHDQVELWVPLYDGAPEGERVFPVPLEALP